MKKLLKTLSTVVIVTSLLSLVFGIVLINYPGMSLVVLDIIVGSYLIVQGIAMIILGIRALIKHIPFEGILSGVLNLILGVLFLENPAGFAQFIGIVLGIWLIVHSISSIRLAVNMRGSGAPWILLVIVNIIGIIAGCSIIYSPIFSSLAYTMALGIVMIVDSIITVIAMIAFKKVLKNAGDDIEEELEAAVKQAVEQAQNTVEPVEATVVENEQAEEPIKEIPAPKEPAEEVPAEETPAEEPASEEE